jgi:hypothetical protein
MRLSSTLLRITGVLLPLSVLSTAYLYLYPFVHGCGFPTPPPSQRHGFQDCAFDSASLQEYYRDGNVAPFRLLALGDPQLEGDTSLPEAVEYAFPGFKRLLWDLRDRNVDAVKEAAIVGLEDVLADLGRLVKFVRKQVDLVGNDYYLAHIYRTLDWYTKPTHVTVLGDLLGSQWIGDEEFESRKWRFWERVFKGAKLPESGRLTDLTSSKEEDEAKRPSIEVLGEADWRKRIINLAGNHDIGYAGDIDEGRIKRFEAAFGPVNGDIHFTLPSPSLCIPSDNIMDTSTETPTLRLVVLNSMNLDYPALSNTLQGDTYNFINSVIATSAPVESHSTATILLTHIPLHKDEGVCADAPFFSFFSDDEGGGVKEQNMISADLSKSAVLQGLFGKSPDPGATMRGLGRDGIVLTGHDHEGCDVYHFADRESADWRAKKWTSVAARNAVRDDDVPGLREVTLRSMMGEFGGNAGLVSAWWDAEAGRWKIAISTCSAGVQHIWWAVHVLDILTVLIMGAAGVVFTFEAWRDSGKRPKDAQSKKQLRKGKDIKKEKAKGIANGNIGDSHKPAVKLKS